jgi:hypothetical protein
MTPIIARRHSFWRSAGKNTSLSPMINVGDESFRRRSLYPSDFFFMKSE